MEADELDNPQEMRLTKRVICAAYANGGIVYLWKECHCDVDANRILCSLRHSADKKIWRAGSGVLHPNFVHHLGNRMMPTSKDFSATYNGESF
jgi:hypothetical protein